MAESETDEGKAVDKLVAKLVPYLRDGAEKFAAIEIRLKHMETEVDKMAAILTDGNPSLVTDFALLRRDLAQIVSDFEEHDSLDVAKHSKFDLDLKGIAEKLAKDLKDLIEKQTVPAAVRWQVKATIIAAVIAFLTAVTVAYINLKK